MDVEEFNQLSGTEVAEALRGCVDIDSWVVDLAGGRPYGSTEALLDAARAHVSTWSADEVDAALAGHPRIGERAAGDGASAARSAREQAGVDPADAELAARLREGNARYEERFGRIYLVRARGRTGPELLELLEERLTHDPPTEAGTTRQQLGEIALLRLADLVATKERGDR